jgi:Uma2 family endonuclease
VLLIEAADSSLCYDRRLQSPLYAEAGVPEYWIVDLEGGAVEVYRSPSGDRFESVQRAGITTILAPLAFPDVRSRPPASSAQPPAVEHMRRR